MTMHNEAVREIEERQTVASAQIERLVGLFRDADPQLRAVVLFGSLAHGTPRSPHFDIDLAGRVDELRRFRHVFRNMYANDLHPRRVAAVQETLAETIARFFSAHDRFLHDLDLMIAEVAKQD